MERVSVAISGCNYMAADPMAVAYTAASTAQQAILQGGYSVTSTTDCDVKFGLTGLTAAVVIPATQSGAPTGTVRFYAGIAQPLDVGPGVFFRCIGVTAAGSLVFNGPLRGGLANME